MKLFKLLLMLAIFLGFGLTACSGQTDAEKSGETTVQEPKLIMFYTDN